MKDNLISITDIYNKFAFEWVFYNDSMKWQKPAHIMLGETSLYESGDHFANRLTLSNIDKRLSAIHKAAVDRVPYTVNYEMQVHGDKVAQVQEQGRVFFSPQGEMVLCRGYLSSKEIRPQLQNEYLSTQDIIQKLDDILEHGDQEDINAAFVYLCVDKLPTFGIRYGVKVMHKLMDQVNDILKKSTRAYDTVGPISGTSFGVILQKCGNNEIVIVAKRFTEAIEQANFKADGEDVKLIASIGGCVIQRTGNNITSKHILQHSERALLDAQHIKKIAVPTSHVAHHLESGTKKNPKKRRNEDIKSTGS